METEDNKGCDLANIDVVKDANAGAEVNIYHPGTRADLGISIRVVGQDSTQFRKISAEQNRRRIARATKGGSFKLNVFTPEEIESDKCKLLAACTLGWKGVVEGGKEIPFSVSAAEDLYERFSWIREQVDEAIGDRALFTKS
jgi:hypothetical protein